MFQEQSLKTLTVPESQLGFDRFYSRKKLLFLSLSLLTALLQKFSACKTDFLLLKLPR